MQHEKLMKINHKLKRVVQIFKEKLQRLANDRTDLFLNVGDDTNERLDHMIFTIQEQADRLELLQAERIQLDNQLQCTTPASSYA
jgi:hypothetical protein